MCRDSGDDVTPLHVSVRRQLMSLASLLLSHAANVNAPTRYDRRSPLHSAAVAGHVALLRLLVDNGAALDQTDLYGSTPLHLAVVGRRTEVRSVSSSRAFNTDCAISQPGASQRFRKWEGGYKFVRTLYSLVVKVVCLKF